MFDTSVFTELPFVDTQTPDYMQNPHRFIAEARQKSWIARTNDGLMVLEFDAMQFVLRDKRFRTANYDLTAMMGQEGTPFARLQNETMQAKDGETHQRLRMLVAPSFTPGEADKHRPYMREVMNAIVDKVADKGQCDFVTDVSLRYPITVFCRLLGVDPADIDKFKDWLEAFFLGHSNDPESIATVNQACTNMFEYAESIIQARKESSEHPDDLLQSFIDANVDGDKLSDYELVNLLVVVLFAGYDTTKNQLNWVMSLLCEHPEEYDKLVEDPSRISAFVQESIRFRSPLGLLYRVSNEEVEYRDFTIPANTLVCSAVVAAGRDPKVADNPETFNPDRPEKKYLAFGHGIHICAGKWLAQAMLEEALPTIVKRMKNPRLSGPMKVKSLVSLWGLASLPVTFEAEASNR